MNQLLGFVKEFTHIFRDPRTMVILFGIPVIQLMLFGYVITTEIKDARIAILDHSNDNVTREIKNKILSSGYFRLEANLLQENEIDPIFKKGDVKEVIVFEKGLQKIWNGRKANIQVIADASDPNTAQMLFNYTNGIVQDYTKRSLRIYQSSSDKKRGSDALQRKHGGRLHVCPRHHGADPDADLSDDDLHHHCTGEGDGHHGDPARLPIESHAHHPRESGALPVAFPHRRYCCCLPGECRVRGTHPGKHLCTGIFGHPIHYHGLIAGHSDLNGGQQSAGSIVHFRVCTYAAHHPVIGLHLSN